MLLLWPDVFSCRSPWSTTSSELNSSTLDLLTIMRKVNQSSRLIICSNICGSYSQDTVGEFCAEKTCPPGCLLVYTASGWIT